MEDRIEGHAPVRQARGEAMPGLRRTQPTDEDFAETLSRARKGDDDAFRMIYRTMQPALLRYLRALVGSDAEDVASEAWLQIVRDLPSFTGGGDGFRGWAATIARHRALDHLRHQRRRPAAPTPVEELLDVAGADDTAGHALATVSTDAAIAMIASLPRGQAEAVLLRVVIGLDVPTTAHVLGIRPGAVRTATHRGLRRLAEHLTVGVDEAKAHE